MTSHETMRRIARIQKKVTSPSRETSNEVEIGSGNIPAPWSDAKTTGASGQSGSGNAVRTPIHTTKCALSAHGPSDPASCRSCLFSGLKPATEADAWRQGGRYIRTCALDKNPAAVRGNCASWTRDPGDEAVTPAALAHAVRRAREARI